MSKSVFVSVVSAIKNSPEIAIAGVTVNDYLHENEWPKLSGRWGRTIDVFAYPYKELDDLLDGANTVVALNALLDHFARIVKPTQTEPNFYSDIAKPNHVGIRVGHLAYFETIGTITTRSTVKLDGFMADTSPTQQMLQWDADKCQLIEQSTSVRLYPNKSRANDAGCGINYGYIPNDNSDLLALRTKYPQLTYNFDTNGIA